MKVGYWLARLGGAQEEVLRTAPGDVPKHTSLGAVLIGTAAIAATSAAFALNTAVDLPVVPAVLVGLLWGLLILNLDRMLVVSMGRRNGVWANVATALPRLLLALLIGAVMSVPLVLRIFQPEIDAELQVMRNEALNAAQTRLNEDQRFAAIPALEIEEDRLQSVVAGQQRASVADDPEVQRLQEQFDAKEAEFRQAEQEIICENDGTCGTGVVGRGPSYEEKLDRKDRLEAERNALQAQLDQAKAAAADRIESGSVQEKQSAAAELARVQAQLDALRTERTFEEDRTRATEIQNDGLLARLEALDRLSEDRPTMWLAHWTLILLFVCIELLPVLVKMLASAGPKTVYEKLLERREAHALDTDQIWSDKQREIAGIRVGVRVQLEQHLADEQVEAGKRASATLVATQQEISESAIQVWAEVAKRRTDDELARWYTQHSRASATVPAPPAASPRPATSPTSTTAPPGSHQHNRFNAIQKHKVGASVNGNVELVTELPAYIFLAVGEESTVEHVRTALQALAKQAGFYLTVDSDPTYGSFWQRFKAKASNPQTQEALNDRLIKLERSAEVRLLAVPESQANMQNAHGLAAIIESLKGEPAAVVQLGPLLVVKTPAPDVGSAILCRMLNAKELRMLEKCPDLLKNPAMLMAQLTASGHDQDQDNGRAQGPPAQHTIPPVGP